MLIFQKCSVIINHEDSKGASFRMLIYPLFKLKLFWPFHREKKINVPDGL